MKAISYKLLLGSFITGLLFFSSIGSVQAYEFYVPSNTAPLNQRDKFDTDLFTGTANYSYPIKVPKGTNDLTPQVTIAYNSSGVKDLKTSLGLGWQINEDYIERDINYSPSSTSDDTFKLHFKGTVYDLVYVSSENLYHTKVESFLRIEKKSTGANNYGDYFVVTDKDGTQYRFGASTNSELTCAGRYYASRLYMDQVQDTHGNYMYYTYTQNNGISYISKIEYDTDKDRTVEFNYSTNPYEHPVYNQGCYAYDLKRLTNIQVKANASLVREYDIAFGIAANTQPVMTSITEKGSDRTAYLPTTFDYKGEARTWATTPDTWLNHQPLAAHLDDANETLIDVNGDGLADIVKSDHGSSPNVTWKVLLNNGSGWSTSWSNWVNNASMEGVGLSNDNTRLLDVTGDGLPDIVMAPSAGSWWVWRNTGTSWSTTKEYWADLHSTCSCLKLDDPHVTLADVNGDGLPDIVRTWWNGAVQWEVNLNTGSGWNSTPVVWNLGSIPVGIDDSELRLIDVNGDGMADVVRTVHSGTFSTWYVWLSTGTGWGPQSIWLDADVYAYFDTNDITLADVNGDGLPDIVRSEDGGTSDRWKVLYNRGGSWTSSWEDWITTADHVDLDIHNNNTKLVDVNGDGLPDIVKGVLDCGCDYSTWTVYKNNEVAPNLLNSVHLERGGVITFDYDKSTKYDNTGGDGISDLPFSMWVVSQMSVFNGLTNDQGTTDVTNYAYKSGSYKWQDKEFRGFGEVTETLPNTSVRVTSFLQDDALKGKPYFVRTSDSSGNNYAGIENSWGSTSTSGYYIPQLNYQKEYTYDGNNTSPKVKQTDYTYDSYGNVLKKSDEGDTSVSGDERYTYNEYTYDTTDWILNSVKHSYLNAADDSTKLSETWDYYDGHTGLGDAPTKGDLTQEVKWLSGTFATNPVTTYTYDSFGNQTGVTDANSHTTTTAYDTTGTYPVSTTNAKSQTSTMSYDLGTGNILSKTDPNGGETDYNYDVYGRITKEIQPYDSSTYPTTLYTYYTDGTDGTKVSKREVSGAADTLDTYTWIDGLGRTVQTRTPAENTSNQNVTNTYYDSSGQTAKVTVPHADSLVDYYKDPLASISATVTSYDVIGRPTIITNPKGDFRTIAYDHGKETTVDEKGHIKRNYKNAYDKITKVEEVNNGSTYTTTYEYDVRDLLTKITDNASNDTTFTYDSLGRKTSQTDTDMGTWNYEYDGVGNLTKQTDNRGIAVTKTYDALDRLTKTDYPTDIDTTYLYDANARIGTLTTATDSAGTVNYLYDNRLRKTQEQRKVGSTTKTTQFSYDAANRTTTQTNPDGEVVTYAFNPQGEIKSVSNVVSNIDYNALGKITEKDFANGLTTNYTYNTTDFRLNKIQTGSLQNLDYTYDNVGNVSTITDNVTSKTQAFTYDDLDRLKTASESAGYNYSYDYSSIGNMTKSTNAGVETDYSYGANGKAHALTSSNESTNPPAVNPVGVPLTSTITDNWASGSINSSKWGNWGGSQVTVSGGALQMQSSLGGGYYGVDSSVDNRVYDLTGSSVVNELVDAGNQSLGSWEVYPLYTYVNGDSSTQYFFYISGGTLRAYKKVSGSNTVLASATYNTTNHKWFRIRESGGTTYFDTSADGQSWSNFTSTANAFTLTSMVVGSEVGTWSSESSTTAAVFDNFNYTAAPAAAISDDWNSGSISSSKWGNWGGSNVTVSDSQINMLSNTGGGYYGLDSGVSGNTYNLTNSYVVNELVDAGNQSLDSWEVYPIYTYVNGDSSTQYFFYISGGTLKAYKKVSGSNTVLASASFNATNHKWFRIRESKGTTYFDTSPDGGTWTNFASTADAFNLTSMVVGTEVGTWNSEASTTTAKFDNFNVWTPTYVYDANGNMTSDGANCYEYNDANQLSKVTQCGNTQTVADYVYDYNGNRMVKKNYTLGTLVNTVTSWSDSYESKAIVGGSTENIAYYWVNGELLAKKNPDGSRYYYQNDHLSSASLMTDATGALVEFTKYDPWGAVLSGGTKSKFQYTGQEKDSETGLNYYNARYYDSHMHRFTQPDDVVQNVYQPQTLNRYSYVQNNPLKYTDPTGHVSILDYNKVLSNPSAQSYNNVISQFASIGGNKSSQSFSSNNNSMVAGASTINSQSTNKSSQKPFVPNIVTIQNNMKEASGHHISLSIQGLDNIIWFYQKVHNTGDWDYKLKCEEDCQDFGNINFAATGREAGFSQNVLKNGAGVAQIKDHIGKNDGTIHGFPVISPPFGDDIRDDVMTTKGYTEIGKWY